MNNTYKANLLKQLHNSNYNWNKYALFGWVGKQLNSAANAVGDAASAVGNTVGDATSYVGRQFLGESDINKARREARQRAEKRRDQTAPDYRFRWEGGKHPAHKQTPTTTYQAKQVKQTPQATQTSQQATQTAQQATQTPTPQATQTSQQATQTPTPQATPTGQQTGTNSAVNTILNYRPADSSSYDIKNPMDQHMDYEQSDDEFMKEYEQENNITPTTVSATQQTQQTGQQQTGQQQQTQQTQLNPGLWTRMKNWWNNNDQTKKHDYMMRKKEQLGKTLQSFKQRYAQDPTNPYFGPEAQAKIQNDIDALTKDIESLTQQQGAQTVKTSSVYRMTKRAHFRANGLRLIGKYIREENNK